MSEVNHCGNCYWPGSGGYPVYRDANGYWRHCIREEYPGPTCNCTWEREFAYRGNRISALEAARDDYKARYAASDELVTSLKEYVKSLEKQIEDNNTVPLDVYVSCNDDLLKTEREVGALTAARDDAEARYEACYAELNRLRELQLEAEIERLHASVQVESSWDMEKAINDWVFGKANE